MPQLLVNSLDWDGPTEAGKLTGVLLDSQHPNWWQKQRLGTSKLQWSAWRNEKKETELFYA
jgi:hypothetical protein